MQTLSSCRTEYFGRLGMVKVSFGSWLCENAKTLNRDRRTCSSKTVLVAQRASGFNLEIELKNIILRRVSIFEFLHSQGHSRHFDRAPVTSGLPQQADNPGAGQHVSKVPQADVALSLRHHGSTAREIRNASLRRGMLARLQKASADFAPNLLSGCPQPKRHSACRVR